MGDVVPLFRRSAEWCVACEGTGIDEEGEWCPWCERGVVAAEMLARSVREHPSSRPE